ncbi:MAG: SpoIIE family protein phosphatase [Candidatus Kapabacteria bacterium]|jgi:serine phosphatase RsbU (regulator of sigma subunit)/iron only hydrogenase large subunit-like protein|nr:SpoIIE family protein phosphatase [Candidatus Kapabacteria bacterium]
MNALISEQMVPIIGIDEEKCVNCHTCISKCPVKYCNDGSGDHVVIYSELCIGCGNCLKACTHDARYYIDDMDQFITDAANGEKMVAIVAPAVAANFPDQYLNLNGWLKDMGIDAFFDVSFGAELTVRTYLEHIKKNGPKSVIAQPCPAIVSYIELYRPELLEYLAPADSPMLHAMKMVREYYPEFKDHKLVVVSPCLAKKREFVITGYGDYNIGYKSIDNYIKSNNINLADYPEVDFDNQSAERAVLFSTPGGLLRTAERWNKDIKTLTRKIEGTETIYEYLDKLYDAIQNTNGPFLVDCLNCERGCNGGTLTITEDKSIDEIEHLIEMRNNKMQAQYLTKAAGDVKRSVHTVEEIVDKFWKEGLYDRSYTDRQSIVDFKMPDDKLLKGIFKTMHKYSDEDIYNCSSCGYNSCEKMAQAIFNKLNKPENCHFYLAKESENAHIELLELNANLEQKVEERTVELNEINQQIMDSIRYSERIQQAILTSDQTMKKAFPRSFIYFRPKDILSGDFFWLHNDGETVLVAAVDCTGHGIPGSMLSMIGFMILNEIVTLGNTRDPATILKDLNNMINVALKKSKSDEYSTDGMDVCLCSVNNETREIVYAGARRPLYYITKGELKEIKGDRISIGEYLDSSDHNFTNHKLTLNKDDMLYLSTDGVFDQFSGAGKRFGTARMKEEFENIYDFTCEEQLGHIQGLITSHQGSEEQIDDITVIGIKL